MLKFIPTEEGFATPDGSTAYSYQYNLKDHLGSTRVTFDIYSGAARKIQTTDYLPFGLEINIGTALDPKNNYLYNGKELQGNMQMYDYGARFYDPVIGRWTTVDPLAEVNRRWSPYGYVKNNPVSRIDPDGMIDYQAPLDVQLEKSGFYESKRAARLEKAESFVNNRLGLIFGDKGNAGTPAPANNEGDLGNIGGPGGPSKVPANQRGRPSDSWFRANGWTTAPWYGNFLGPGPNLDPYKLLGPGGHYLQPIDYLDAAAQRHDYFYNLAHTGGISGALFNMEVRAADLFLAAQANVVITFAALGIKDPVSNKYVTALELRWAIGVTALFSDLGAAKYTRDILMPSPTGNRPSTGYENIESNIQNGFR